MRSIFFLTFKLLIVTIVLFGISQITIGNKKIYYHIEAFADKKLHEGGDYANEKILQQGKKKVAIYLKNQLEAVLDESTGEPVKNISNIKETDSQMDEKELKRVLGK